MRSILFILGTPYCGSTLLASQLDKSNDVFNIGEIDRISHLGSNRNPLNDHWCEYCHLSDERCPIFTEELIKKIRSAHTHHEIYQVISHVTSAQVLIDGSKHAYWFNVACTENSIRKLARPVVLVRHPVSFALSSQRRHQEFNRPLWRWFEIWRDTYYDILRTCSRNELPYLLVRHEDLCKRSGAILQTIRSFAGITQYESDTGNPSQHYIGGNPEFTKKLKIEPSPSIEFISTDQESDELIFAKEQLLNTPGAFDLYRNIFGYY